MKDWYFYQEQGKTMGPLTASDLRARIRDGRLRLFDLIYKEGEPGWRMALEHPDLRDEFKAMTGGNTKERPWVCLHRKNEQSFDFITLGPYSEEEVRSAVRAGKLSYADYIWRDEFTEWRRIGSLEEFNPRARKPAPPQEDKSPEELLRSVVEMKRGRPSGGGVQKPGDADTEDLTKPKGSWDPEAATRIVTSKPLAEDEATRLVPRGFETRNADIPTRVLPRTGKHAAEDLRNAKNTDPDATRIVGKNSDPDATRIVSKNTDPDATRIVGTPATPDLDATRIMKGGGGPPPVPEHTGTEPRVFRRSTPGEELPEDEEDDGPGTQTIFRRRRRRFIRLSTDWAIVGGLVACLALAIVIISKRMQKSAPEPIPYSQIEALEPGSGELTPPAPEGITALPPVGAPEIPPPAPPAPPKAEDIPPPVVSTKPVSKPPTQLVLNVQGANSSTARIEVRSNGSSDFPVYVQIVGLPGQVSEGAAFYKYLRLKPTGNPNQPLDLGDIRLPQGRFLLRAETGDLKKQATLNLGVGEAQFKQAVAKERKAQAGAIWQERLRLFKVTRTLEAALMQSLAGKRFSAAGLDSLNVLKKANGANYILFDDWWEAKEIVQEAKGQVTPALLERAKKLNDRLATFSVWRNK